MLADQTTPELADEIEFRQLKENGYILSNTFHRHYVKINQDTYNLLLLIDGTKTISEICAAFNEKYQKDIHAKTVIELLQNKLAQYGVLKGFEESIKPYEKPSYLKLSTTVIDEKTLSKAVKFFYFLFFKWIAIALVVISMSLIGFLLYFNFNLYQKFNIVDSTVYMILLMTVSLVFHELGHATSTSYFGAKYGSIGIGFYLLSPVFYADVTDVWRLPKAHRIIVNLAGVYFELLFCAFVLVIGSIIHNNSIIIVSITIFIHTLFNLNPFLRRDGYWILSDLMGMPNLMNHSLRKMNEALSLIKGIKIHWNKIDFFLFIYGIINYTSMVLFLYYVLLVTPNSILLFPEHVINIVTDFINGKNAVSYQIYFELLISVTFYILVFRLIKAIALKIFNKAKSKKLKI